MRSSLRFAAPTIFTFAVACGGNSSSPSSSSSAGGSGGAGDQNPMPTAFATSFCMKATACGIAATNCTDTVSAVVWSADCQSALLQAACSDIAMTDLPPALAAICTPPCSPASSYVCNADATLTECTASGTQVIADCNGVCQTQGKKYTGDCSDSYMGVSSSKGHAVCWCS